MLAFVFHSCHHFRLMILRDYYALSGDLLDIQNLIFAIQMRHYGYGRPVKRTRLLCLYLVKMCDNNLGLLLQVDPVK